MKLGVCYYPEHWPREWWAEDARRMAELGLAHVAFAFNYAPETRRAPAPVGACFLLGEAALAPGGVCAGRIG
jgi:hypothetical protein